MKATSSHNGCAVATRALDAEGDEVDRMGPPPLRGGHGIPSQRMAQTRVLLSVNWRFPVASSWPDPVSVARASSIAVGADGAHAAPPLRHRVYAASLEIVATRSPGGDSVIPVSTIFQSEASGVPRGAMHPMTSRLSATVASLRHTVQTLVTALRRIDGRDVTPMSHCVPQCHPIGWRVSPISIPAIGGASFALPYIARPMDSLMGPAASSAPT